LIRVKEESDLDKITALSGEYFSEFQSKGLNYKSLDLISLLSVTGSGPAYFFAFTEALREVNSPHTHTTHSQLQLQLQLQSQSHHHHHHFLRIFGLSHFFLGSQENGL
jgi:hypothetical protein